MYKHTIEDFDHLNPSAPAVQEPQSGLSPRSTKNLILNEPFLQNSKPSDTILNQKSNKLLLSKDLKKSLPEPYQKRKSIIRNKNESNIDFKDLNDIIPEWLTSRPDFQRSYQKMKQNESADLEKIVLTAVSQRTEDEKEAIFVWLRSINFFKNMPKIIIKEISERLTLAKHQANEVSNFYIVIKKGSKGECLYIIYKGTVGVYLNNAKIAYNTQGGYFGDLALNNSSTRTADVIAETNVSLFLIKDIDYKTIVFNYKNIEKHENSKFLLTIPFFSKWSITKIQLMSNSLIPSFFKSGEKIFEFNEKSHVFYLLKTGRVELQTYIDLKHKNRWPIAPHIWNTRKVITKYLYPVLSIGPGEFFGEYEVIKSIPRGTRAIALEDTSCLSLNKGDFDILLNTKDQQALLKIIESSFPTQAEMENKLRLIVQEKAKKQKILFDAMKIAHVPVDKNFFDDPRSKRIKRWMENVMERDRKDKDEIRSKIVKKISKNKIKKIQTLELKNHRSNTNASEKLSSKILEFKSMSQQNTPRFLIQRVLSTDSKNFRSDSIKIPINPSSCSPEYEKKSDNLITQNFYIDKKITTPTSNNLEFHLKSSPGPIKSQKIFGGSSNSLVNIHE
jgi:CRP-like cAMP-binding protein